MSIQIPLERVLDRLDRVRELGGDRFLACCPAHDDKSPSLSIKAADNKVLIHCFALCPTVDVLHAIGLSMSDLYASSVYRNYETRVQFSRQETIPALRYEINVLLIAAEKAYQGEHLTDSDILRTRAAWERVDRGLRVIE